MWKSNILRPDVLTVGGPCKILQRWTLWVSIWLLDIDAEDTHTSLLWLKALLLSTSGACHFLSSIDSTAPTETPCVVLRYNEPNPHSFAVKSPPTKTPRAPMLPWIHCWLCKYSLKKKQQQINNRLNHLGFHVLNICNNQCHKTLSKMNYYSNAENKTTVTL